MSHPAYDGLGCEVGLREPVAPSGPHKGKAVVPVRPHSALATNGYINLGTGQS